MNERPEMSDGTTGYDRALSVRRDLWGDDCPCTDIDHMLGAPQPEWPAVEYAYGKAKALIEYKQLIGPKGIILQPETLAHQNIDALLSISDTLPIGVAVYLGNKVSPWQFWVPLSEKRKPLGNAPFRRELVRFVRERGITPEAQQIAPGIEALVLGELEWVRFLFFLRGLTCPNYVIESIKQGLKISPTIKLSPEELKG